MEKLSKKALSLSSIIAIIAGVFIGAFAMYAAWDHNPSGEIHSEGVIHWTYWCGIGVSWLVVVGFVTFFILGVIPVGVIELWAKFKKPRQGS